MRLSLTLTPTRTLTLTLSLTPTLTLNLILSLTLTLTVREQALFQCAMTALRAVVILLMAATLLLGERADFGLAAEAAPLPLVRC